MESFSCQCLETKFWHQSDIASITKDHSRKYRQNKYAPDDWILDSCLYRGYHVSNRLWVFVFQEQGIIRVTIPLTSYLSCITWPSPLHHHLLHPCRSRKIILSYQQITLLCDTRRVAEPRADHGKRELALQFCLSFSPHRVEQSWPTRDPGAAQQT